LQATAIAASIGVGAAAPLGGYHTIAIDTSGQDRGWGNNDDAQIFPIKYPYVGSFSTRRPRAMWDPFPAQLQTIESGSGCVPYVHLASCYSGRSLSRAQRQRRVGCQQPRRRADDGIFRRRGRGWLSHVFGASGLNGPCRRIGSVLGGKRRWASEWRSWRSAERAHSNCSVHSLS
jgi:hypothetical protein